MKHLALIAFLFLVSAPALADAPVAAPQKIVLFKTTSQQRALTEDLSARIKSALLGERFTLGKTCGVKNCDVSASE